MRTAKPEVTFLEVDGNWWLIFRQWLKTKREKINWERKEKKCNSNTPSVDNAVIYHIAGRSNACGTSRSRRAGHLHDKDEGSGQSYDLRVEAEGINVNRDDDDYTFFNCYYPFRWCLVNTGHPSVTKCHELIWRKRLVWMGRLRSATTLCRNVEVLRKDKQKKRI